MFVQVIAALTLKTLPQLGYDPTMTLLYRSPTDELDAQWRVEAPGGQRFVIFQPITLNRARVIVGRATRAWKAWREESTTEENRQVRLCFAVPNRI
jgi:hypothetical protein